MVCLVTWILRLARTPRAVREPDAMEKAAFWAAQQRFPVGPPVELQIVAAGYGPLARGWWRHLIALPDGLFGQLSAAELEAVIIHELAHVRRHDNLSAAFVRTVVSCFWFHPLLWWLERRMLAEREHACDELVLRCGTVPADYAAGILKVCRLAFAGPTVYAGAMGSDLKSRMEHIMSTNVSPSSNHFARVVLGAFLFTAAIIPVAGGFLSAQTHAPQQAAVAAEANPIERLLDTVKSQVSRQDYAAALKSAAEVLKIDPANRAARLLQAAALTGQRRYQDALAVIEDVLRTEPDCADALFQMGTIHLADQKFALAEAAYRRTWQVEPAGVRGLLGIVEVDFASGRKDEAVALLQAEVAKAPDRADLRLALGNAAVRAQAYDLALSAFQHLLEGIGADSKAAGDLYLRIGETARRKGDFNIAITALLEASRLQPDNSLPIVTLALVYDSAGRKMEARQTYEAALKLQPRHVVALNNLAYLLSENHGDLDRAESYARQAAQLSPTLYEVQDTVGWVYLKRGNTKDAVDAFAAVVRAQPARFTFRYHLGLALVQQKDYAGARRELSQALKCDPKEDEARKIQDLLRSLP